MAPEQGKGRILIVDDQDGIRESMAGILELEGYEIFAFDDGNKALETIREIPFDFAFLDVRMPGIGGIDILRSIKKVHPETIVFIMTAFAEDDLMRQAREAGASGCIHKPFEMEQIIETMRLARQQERDTQDFRGN